MDYPTTDHFHVSYQEHLEDNLREDRAEFAADIHRHLKAAAEAARKAEDAEAQYGPLPDEDVFAEVLGDILAAWDQHERTIRLAIKQQDVRS